MRFMDMVRVLHVIDSTNLGGIQTLLKGIFENHKENKNIFLYSLRKTEINININHKNFIVSKSLVKYSIKDLFILKDIIRSNNISIIHCHQIKSQFFGYLLKLFFFKNITLIFHEHGQVLLEKSKSFSDFFFIIFLKKAKKKVNLFIAVSKIIKKTLIKKSKIPENKIKFLYNFVDLDKFNKKNIKWDIRKERQKLGIKNDEFVIGFAARLVQRKGWKDFIKSSSIILKENTKIKFLIAGDGQGKKKLINLIKELKLKKNMYYLGYVSDMVWFYSLLDCFVIPSHWEPMGLTEIEAQALGVPVIASDVPALNEIIADKFNGLLFKAKNEKDLAKKIILLYNNKKLRTQLVKNSLKDVRKYSLEEYIMNLDKIYNGI
jgi:L-malate glycosyltransferase